MRFCTSYMSYRIWCNSEGLGLVAAAGDVLLLLKGHAGLRRIPPSSRQPTEIQEMRGKPGKIDENR